ncbi:MAG: PHP domain-containing protein [Nitrososphaerota archaeon]
MISLDFHLHTHGSFDSKLDVLLAIEKAIKEGLNVVAITDHNNIEIAKKTETIVRRRNLPLKVIVGEEISTDVGEIIGLFLKKKIEPNKAEKVIEEIRNQDGIVYLPHPFKRSSIVRNPELLEEVDIIEIWNCRTNFEQNYKAVLLSKQYKKINCCGSDSHFLKELGRCKLILDSEYPLEDLNSQTILELTRKSKFKIVGTNKNFIFFEFFSQLLKSFKLNTVKPLKNALIYISLENILGRTRTFNCEIAGKGENLMEINIYPESIEKHEKNEK